MTTTVNQQTALQIVLSPLSMDDLRKMQNEKIDANQISAEKLFTTPIYKQSAKLNSLLRYQKDSYLCVNIAKKVVKFTDRFPAALADKIYCLVNYKLGLGILPFGTTLAFSLAITARVVTGIAIAALSLTVLTGIALTSYIWSPILNAYQYKKLKKIQAEIQTLQKPSKPTAEVAACMLKEWEKKGILTEAKKRELEAIIESSQQNSTTTQSPSNAVRKEDAAVKVSDQNTAPNKSKAIHTIFSSAKAAQAKMEARAKSGINIEPTTQAITVENQTIIQTRAHDMQANQFFEKAIRAATSPFCSKKPVKGKTKSNLAKKITNFNDKKAANIAKLIFHLLNNRLFYKFGLGQLLGPVGKIASLAVAITARLVTFVALNALELVASVCLLGLSAVVASFLLVTIPIWSTRLNIDLDKAISIQTERKRQLSIVRTNQSETFAVPRTIVANRIVFTR